MIKNLRLLVCILCSALLFSNCSSSPFKTLKVGVTPGLYSDLLRFAASQALQNSNLKINILVKPATEINALTVEGKLDANFFQTAAALATYNRINPQDSLQSYGTTYIAPMSLYSANRSDIYKIKNNDLIYIPNNRTRQALALQVLQHLGLITLTKVPAHQVYSLDDVTDGGAVPVRLRTIDIAALDSTTAHQANGIILYPDQSLILNFTHKQILYEDDRNFTHALVLAAKPYASGSPQAAMLHTLLVSLQSTSVQQISESLLGYQLNKAF